MNEKDLIEKLKILLAEKMLEAEEFKRKNAEVDDHLERTVAFYKKELDDIREDRNGLLTERERMAEQIEHLEERLEVEGFWEKHLKGLGLLKRIKGHEDIFLKGKASEMRLKMKEFLDEFPGIEVALLAKEPGLYKTEHSLFKTYSFNDGPVVEEEK